MQNFMFPQRAQLGKFLPKVFKTMRKIRCIVDCTEFRVECSRSFSRQGNTFSSYKHTNMFKCLIAVTPNGGACFISDLFEGDIDDVRIFEKSGIMKHLLDIFLTQDKRSMSSFFQSSSNENITLSSGY